VAFATFGVLEVTEPLLVVDLELLSLLLLEQVVQGVGGRGG
jgi:hypothetical protein